MLIFPLVFSAMTANSLVARHVDRGSMAYLLAAPNSRTRVAFTQMTVLLTGVTAIIAVCTAVGWGCSAAMFPGALDVAGYLRLNLGVWLLHLCLSGLCFFASCISNTTRAFPGAGRRDGHGVLPHPDAGQHGRQAGNPAVYHPVYPVSA